MDNKGQVKIISAVIMGVLGIVFTLVLLSNVAIPQVFNPQAELNATVTNTTALIDLSENNQSVLALTSPDTTYATNATLTVTSNNLVGTPALLVNGEDYGTISGESTEVSVGMSDLASATTIEFGSDAGNVTEVSLFYYQQGEYYDWDAGTQAIWLTIGIALAAFGIIRIIGAF